MTNMNANLASADHGEDRTPAPPAMIPSSIDTPIATDLTSRFPATPPPLPRVNSPPIQAEDAPASALTTANWFEEVDEHSEGIRKAIYEIQSQIPLLLRLLAVHDAPVSAMEAMNEAVSDLESRLDALSNVRVIKASFTAFPFNAWQWRQCDNVRRQLESCLIENRVLVPPPPPDEQDQQQAQIDMYDMTDLPTLKELAAEWEERHAEAWKKAGRKRPRLCWWDRYLGSDDNSGVGEEACGDVEEGW